MLCDSNERTCVSSICQKDKYSCDDQVLKQCLERPATNNAILIDEYNAYQDNKDTCMYSRMVRYPFGSGGRLKTTNGYVEPIGGWFTEGGAYKAYTASQIGYMPHGIYAAKSDNLWISNSNHATNDTKHSVYVLSIKL